MVKININKMYKMLSRIKRLFKKDNRGVALILSIIVVSVLFIFTSFLVRRVVTNTLTVGKVEDEQTSYALAKEGILYAVDRLNNLPDDGTDWPEDENWHDYDIDTEHPGNDVIIKIDKDNPSGYATIQSQDLPKKLVTLEGIADSKSPLLKYVRFINSDTTFENDTFGDSGMIREESPFCILGDLSWKNGSSNNLTLTNNNIAAIYGKITTFDETYTTLKINNNLPLAGFHYYTDPSDPSDPTLFDTAYGHYFDLDHLPSSYDYSTDPPDFHYGTSRALLWPHINEERYKNLASGTNCYIDNPSEINMDTEWSDPNKDNTSDDNDIIDEWFKDGTTSASYHYYPCAARIILNNIDTGGDPSKDDITEVLSSGTTNPIDYSVITNGVIFAKGDISVSGIIPTGEKLTIVSGGNIFIDSNLLKENNSASLALLAKEYIVLNPTLRYATGTTNGSPGWSNPDNILGNPDSNYTSPTSGEITLTANEEKTYTLDIDMGKLVTSGRVVLWDYKDAEDGDPTFLETKLEIWITRQATPPVNDSDWDKEILSSTDVDTTPSYIRDFTPQTFRWIRLNLWAHNIDTTSGHTFDLSKECLDAIEVALYGIDACLFAENGSLKVITGGGVNQDNSILPNNDAYKPEDSGGLKIPSGSGMSTQDLFFWGTLAEHSQEPINEWVEKWPDIAYIYDSNLPSNPPPELPSSVNLVSLSRK